MKSGICAVGILGMLIAGIAPGVWGQTSLGEVNVVIRGMEELGNISGGPSMAGGGATGTGPATGPAGAAAPGAPPPVTGPRGTAVTGPSVPAGPMPVTEGSEEPTTPAVGGSDRTVLAPENGFIPTLAAQRANLGFEFMQRMDFDNAREAYRRARELDSRYETIYQGIVHVTNQISQLGADFVGKSVIAEEPVRITIAKYYGWTR